MPDMLIRNLRPETVEFFTRRAREHGRSLAAEVKSLMEDEEEREGAAVDDFWEQARHLRESIASRVGVLSDSAELIREDRDSDHGRDW